MKIVLACVGHLKASPEKDLLNLYHSRLTTPFEIREIVCRRQGTPEQVKIWEGELLLAALEAGTVTIGLDERGKSFTSIEFSHLIESYGVQGLKNLAFIIGGADGLSEAVRLSCHKLVSFGNMTWPHLLVRVMAVEQIYRAQQILAGHPYHRA